MKKVYKCPTTDVITVNTQYGICQAVSQNAPLNNGGGSQTIDPGQAI